MKHVRIVLLTTLLLLPAARVWAQAYDAAGHRELYHAEVCNQGRITVDVAVAYKDFGFDEFWIVDYWYRVAPGKCGLVFSHFYAPNNLFSSKASPVFWPTVHLLSGVWGATKRYPDATLPNPPDLCVGKTNYKVPMDAKTTQRKGPQGPPITHRCSGNPNRLGVL